MNFDVGLCKYPATGSAVTHMERRLLADFLRMPKTLIRVEPRIYSSLKRGISPFFCVFNSYEEVFVKF